MTSFGQKRTPCFTVSSRQASGFTLIELLVVITIIAVLISITLPSLSRAVHSARLVACKSNLRQIGIGVLAYSTANSGVFCSGPFDNRVGNSYGAIDEAGWLADMVNGSFLIPGELLCPSNPARYTQNMTLDRLDDGRPHRPIDRLERDALIKQGFNTNYTLSWYFGFTEMRHPLNAYVGAPLRVESVIGPLRDKYLGRINPSLVPLMGDGRTDGAFEDLEEFGDGLERVAKAFLDGPVRYPTGIWGRQDFDDFGPAHIPQRRVNADDHNRSAGAIAFADGHVGGFSDTNRDGTFGWRLPEGGILPQTDAYPEIEGRVFGGHLSSGAFFDPGSPLREP